MRPALRFLAWLSIVLAIGVQASGLGSLGFSLCMEHTGGLCGLEAPGQSCCAESTGDAGDDNDLAADTCDLCTDTSLSLPACTAAAPSPGWNHATADVALPAMIPWLLPQQHMAVRSCVRPDRSRAPPLSLSVRIARTIVLRV